MQSCFAIAALKISWCASPTEGRTIKMLIYYLKAATPAWSVFTDFALRWLPRRRVLTACQTTAVLPTNRPASWEAIGIEKVFAPVRSLTGFGTGTLPIH
jgi:hypothetical protein